MSFLGRQDTRSQGFEARTAKLAERHQPFDTHKAGVIGQYGAWFQKQLAIPNAEISGAAPAEVDELLLRIANDRARAGRDYYQSERSGIQSELDAAFTAASDAFAAAAEQMEDFGELQRQHRVFQSACGVRSAARWQVSTSRTTTSAIGAMP